MSSVTHIAGDYIITLTGEHKFCLDWNEEDDYEEFCMELGMLLTDNQNTCTDNVMLIGVDHGYRRLNGLKLLEGIVEPEEVLRAIQGRASEIEFIVYKVPTLECGEVIAITSAHHDSPVVGVEWTYLIKEN